LTQLSYYVPLLLLLDSDIAYDKLNLTRYSSQISSQIIKFNKNKIMTKENKSPHKTFIGGLVIGFITGGVVGWLACASYVISIIK